MADWKPLATFLNNQCYFDWQVSLATGNKIYTVVLGVSVGKRGEGRQVHDAFVEDESVTFGAFDHSKMFGGRIPPEEIGIDHIDVASFVERLCDLVDQVLKHDIIVQLLGSANVQGRPSHFAAGFALTGLVAVILGASRGEFCDEVTVIEFVRDLSQVIS